MNHPLGVALALAVAAIPFTYTYDGMPPKRFQGNATATVRFVTDPNTRGACGVAPRGYVFEGCQGGDSIVMPNPCPRGPTESYARILCHELGHRNGWPGNHGP